MFTTWLGAHVDVARLTLGCSLQSTYLHVMEGQLQHVSQQQARVAAALGEGLASLEDLHVAAGALDVKMAQSLANEVRHAYHSGTGSSALGPTCQAFSITPQGVIILHIYNINTYQVLRPAYLYLYMIICISIIHISISGYLNRYLCIYIIYMRHTALIGYLCTAGT